MAKVLAPSPQSLWQNTINVSFADHSLCFFHLCEDSKNWRDVAIACDPIYVKQKPISWTAYSPRKLSNSAASVENEQCRKNVSGVQVPGDPTTNRRPCAYCNCYYKGTDWRQDDWSQRQPWAWINNEQTFVWNGRQLGLILSLARQEVWRSRVAVTADDQNLRAKLFSKFAGRDYGKRRKKLG